MTLLSLPRAIALAAPVLLLAACEPPAPDAPRRDEAMPNAATSALVPAPRPDRAAARDSVKRPPAPQHGLRIEVNLPAGRLDLFQDGALRKSYPVSVGYYPYKTPVGTHGMQRVIWNPWWTPPESEWAKKRVKTAPGPRNPMGRAKLHLTELIYIHGTVEGSKLGRPASHGCIRMSNADVLELARIIAGRTKVLSSETVAALESRSSQTREVYLPRAVPVHIRYQRAEIRGDSLVVHRDIYGQAKDPMPGARKVWKEAGRDPALLTREVLAAAISRGLPKKAAPPVVVDTLPPPTLLGVPTSAPVAELVPADSARS